MKKIFMFLFILMISLFTLSSAVLADEGDIIANNNVEDWIYEDLNPGEEVVDFYREVVPIDETNNYDIPEKLKLIDDSNKENGITPLERRRKWYQVSKNYVGHSYGSWKYAGASTISGGKLSAKHTRSVSNTYSGSLKVSKKGAEAYIGFSLNDEYNRTVSYTSNSLPKISGKGHRLEYRHVYKKYKVKQELKYSPRSKVYDTSYLYPKRWVERQYRIVKFNISYKEDKND